MSGGSGWSGWGAGAAASIRRGGCLVWVWGRAQERKSAASAALNCAEGAARQTRADKSRAYAIALCECCEACAAIEIAGALGVRRSAP